MDGMRVTGSLVLLLKALPPGPGERCWGWDLIRSTGLASGTLYPLLARLEQRGWLSSGWDDSSTSGPRRRYYQLTAVGRSGTLQALWEASSKDAAGLPRRASEST